ncbi:MAG: hypothetical protein V3V16_09850 [Melioribacteraceae bacterium]
MLYKSNSKLLTTIFLIVVVSLLGSSIFAQKPKNVILELSENAIANLNTAIKSKNPGLRKSAIYLVGKHSIDEVSETLLIQLEIEKNPSIRILIARVLYKIDNEKYINNIYMLAEKDENKKVRKMATAIYKVMRLEKSFRIVDANK